MCCKLNPLNIRALCRTWFRTTSKHTPCQLGGSSRSSCAKDVKLGGSSSSNCALHNASTNSKSLSCIPHREVSIVPRPHETTPSLLYAAHCMLGGCTLPITVHGQFCKPYSVAHVKHGWTVAHLTMCVGRDCGNVLFETQLLLDGQFCQPYPVAHVKKSWLDSCSFDNLRWSWLW